MNRHTSLNLIKENSKETKEIYVFSNLNEIKAIFNDLSNDIEKNLEFASKDSFVSENMLNEFLRYQIIKIESGFDYIVHLIIKLGFINIFREQWHTTDRYNNFPVCFFQLKDAIIKGIDENWVLNMVDNKISPQTYLDYNCLKDGLNYCKQGLISDIAVNIYGKVAHESLELLKRDIGIVYKRRNLIAHQNDIDHKTGEKNNISIEDVNSCKIIIFNFISAALSELEKL